MPAAGELVCDRSTNFFEFGFCVGADGSNSGQTDNYDECQHNGVLNCGWSIFFFQEIYDAVSEILHVSLLASEKHIGGICDDDLKWMTQRESRSDKGTASSPTFV
jgi:hypothetical protein